MYHPKELGVEEKTKSAPLPPIGEDAESQDGDPYSVVGSTFIHPSQQRKTHKIFLPPRFPAKRKPEETYNKEDSVSLSNALQELVWKCKCNVFTPSPFFNLFLKATLADSEVPSTHLETGKTRTTWLLSLQASLAETARLLDENFRALLSTKP